jgi:hypothetical protein
VDKIGCKVREDKVLVWIADPQGGRQEISMSLSAARSFQEMLGKAIGVVEGLDSRNRKKG